MSLMDELERQRTEYRKVVRRYTFYHYGPGVAAAIASLLVAVLVASLPENPTDTWKSVLAILAILPGALAIFTRTLNTRLMYLAAKDAKLQIDNLIANYAPPNPRKTEDEVRDKLESIRSTYNSNITDLA
jgi:hypothetical protein